MSEDMTIYECIENAKAALRDEFEGPNEYGCDLLHEIADGAVPVYTSNLLEVACSDTSLLTDQPGLGTPDSPIQAIQWNVYERIYDELQAYYNDLCDEWEEKQERQEEEAEAAQSWLACSLQSVCRPVA